MQRSEVVERDGRRWYEIQLTPQAKEGARRGITRMFVRGKELFTLSAFAPAAGWAEQEKGLLSLLDSFTLAPAAAVH